MAMCWTRDASQSLELDYSEMMIEAGFTQGSYSTRVFYHKEKFVRSYTEMILQHLEQGAVWIDSVKSFSVAWR